MGQTPVLSARALNKDYGSVRALRDVTFDLWPGEVVGLVGDNGAGKSTLVSLLSGARKPTSGEILLRGEPLNAGHPARTRAAGIEVVYQDLALGLDLDVADNVYLGREITKGGRLGAAVGWLDRKAMRRRAAELLTDLDVRIPGHHRPVRDLSGGQRQGVSVARAVSWVSSVLLLDEPTAALGVEQQESVAAMVRRCASRDIAILLISHNLPQVIELCDRVLVLWRGQLVADLSGEDLVTENLMYEITGSGTAARVR